MRYLGGDVTTDSDKLPAGVKNYMTPNGLLLLQNELRQLIREERPKLVETVRWAAGNGDRSENADYIYGKRRLRKIDRRIRYLTLQIENAKVVDPKMQQGIAQVFFGAIVNYREQNTSEELTVQIVGVDEADISKLKISIISPLAKALLKAKAGDVVECRTPAEIKIIEVLSVKYPC